MEKTEVIANASKLAKQRNLFLALTIALAASNFCLTLKVLTTNERTVMVPGLNQEVWVAGKLEAERPFGI